MTTNDQQVAQIRFEKENHLKATKPFLCPYTSLELLEMTKKRILSWMQSVCCFQFLETENLFHARGRSRRRIILSYQIWIDNWVLQRPQEEIMNPNYCVTEGGTSFLNLPSDLIFYCFKNLKSFINFGQCSFVCKRFAQVLLDPRCWEPIYRQIDPKVTDETILRKNGDFREMFFDHLYQLGTPIRMKKKSEMLKCAIDRRQTRFLFFFFFSQLVRTLSKPRGDRSSIYFQVESILIIITIKSSQL